ncbi:virB8 family protein [Sphingomonas sp. 3-13AW]|uniref:virB8 family protein n=1 Tax=Sphingomonas sp. 3-13AW TaxID=3050450 RepID=UPI003BB7EA59
MSDREAYYRAARSWAEDVRAKRSRSTQIAWMVAGIAVGAAALEAVALALLTPLKTVQPITLLVDRQTGYVQALDPSTPQRVAADSALTDAYVAQYVIGREGFDRATLQVDYRRVALWSTGRARSAYLATMAASNPASPVQSLPAGSVVSVRVKSVSRLQSGVRLVRFDTQQMDGSGQVERSRPWISVIRFQYSDAPMAFADRLVNPLGFQVTSYRRDAEAPPSDSTQALSKVETPAVARRASAIEPMRISASMSPRDAGNLDGAQETAGGVGGPFVAAGRVPMRQVPVGSPLMPSGSLAVENLGYREP